MAETVGTVGNKLVQVNVRLRLRDRDILTAEAKEEGMSLNSWASFLLMQSRDKNFGVTALEALTRAAALFEPLIKEGHLLAVTGDYRRNVSKVLDAVRPLLPSMEGRAREDIEDAAREIEKLERKLGTEANNRFRRMTATGRE
jgi:hypothetical protein